MYDDFLNYMNYPYTMSNRSTYNNKYNNEYRAIPATQVPTDILDLIKDAVASEREDEIFYDFLLASAPNDEDKKIIDSIRNDERHHNELFRKLYLELTGISLPKGTSVPEPEYNLPYIKGLEQALMGELSAVEKYRRILASMEDRQKYNTVMEIMTDELKHASKYNFLITKNMVGMNIKE